jgi:hypothetical protein
MSVENEDNLAIRTINEVEPSDDLQQRDEDYDEGDKFHRILDYIGTKRGDVMIGRVVSMLEQLAPAARKYIEDLGDVKKENPSIEYRKWLALLIVRFLVVVLSLGAAIYLKYTGNLDSTTSLIIVTIATVFFSYGRKQQ